MARMHRIEVVNRQSVLRVNARRLRDGVRRTLEAEGVSQADVSVAVVGDAEMRELNRAHLQHDYPTDVLSFLLDAEYGPRRPDIAGNTATPRRIDGEVVVSAETALRRAPEFGWRPSWELLLYVVHGTLHLCGHDDQTPVPRRRMRRRERAILQTWGMAVNYKRRR